MRSQRSVKDTDRENYAPFEFTVLAIRAIDRTKLAEPGDLNLGVKIHPYISKPPFLLFLSLSCSPSPSISRIPSACRWFVTRRAITISSRGTRETWRNKFQREPSSVSVERERERERERARYSLWTSRTVFMQIRNPQTSSLKRVVSRRTHNLEDEFHWDTRLSEGGKK